MAQSFHEQAHSGSQSAVSISNHSFLSAADSRDNDTDSKDECDDDVLRYNKRLKDRRDRLLEELTRLENENEEHCDKLRDLLKPLELIKKPSNPNNNLSHRDKKIAEQMRKYQDEEDEYEAKLKSNALDGIEEFKIPEITEKMSDEQKKDFLSLLIRYLCLANNYQRNEIKSMYSKQTSLYFQAQGLALDEQCEFHNALSLPIPAFESIDKQNITSIQQLLAKFPDPHKMANAYEKYIKLIKDIDINAQDTNNWQSTAMNGIDEHKSMDSYPTSPSPIASPPSMHARFSGSTSSVDTANLTRNDSDPRKQKKSIFRFSRKKSQEKISSNNNNNNIKHEKQSSMELNNNNNNKHRGSTASNSSVCSTGTEQSIGNGSERDSIRSHTLGNDGYISPRNINTKSISFGAVSMMGSKANAPSVASTLRNTAISGSRLIRFDPDYKQLSSRRQRCDVASIIAAFQNTHNMHGKMKQRLPAFGEDPFSCSQNYGFDMRYTDGKTYEYDTILDDKEMLRQYKEEQQKNNNPLTPAMNAMNAMHIKSATTTISNLVLNPRNSNQLQSNGHIATQSLTATDIEQGSSRNLHNIMYEENKNDDDEDINKSRPPSARKWTDEINAVFTQVSKPVMNVNKEKAVRRPGWITLNQFIHLATNFGAHGLRDAQVLVLTHRTFCESKELLKGLRKRFWMPIPPNITPSEVSAFKTTHVKQIRGKIIAVLRYWLTKHWNDDFRDDFGLQRRMNKFISEINLNEESQSMSIYLAQAFERQKKENAIKSLLDHRYKDQTKQKKKVVKFFYDTKTIDILDFKPEETAACITELNCKSFLLIDQRECFEWIKHKEKAPNVGQMISRWNAMGNWAQREMLSQKRDFKKRLQCIQYFIQIADILTNLGDFSGAYAINSALNSTPVHRLKRYFNELSKTEQNVLRTLSELFTVSGNYPNLRVKMKNYLSKPCVPHVGLFTRDLTMLAEQKSFKLINKKKYINFGKCQTLAKQIGDLKMYQNNINKFNLKYQKPLLDYVETQLQEPSKSENDLYKISIIVEPKATLS